MKTRFTFERAVGFIRRITPNHPSAFIAISASIITAVLFFFSLAAGAAMDQPSLPLQIGERVQIINETPVFLTPPYAGRFEGNVPAGMRGSITAGPIRAGDVWWWNVLFDDGSNGWIAGRQIQNASGQSGGSILTESVELLDHTHPPTGFVEVSPRSGSTVRSSQILLRGTVTHDVYSPTLVAFSINGTNVPLDDQGNFSFPLSLQQGINTFSLRGVTANPRQQPNEISAYLDGSVIYGSNPTRAAALRSFHGGRLKTSPGNLPPLNTAGLPNANDAHRFPDNELFLCGDVRANENVELTAIQTLFVREHNQIANAIASVNHFLSDEQVYQRARRIVVGELQVITYNEFLPALLGPNALRPYSGYNRNVNPGIATEFSTAAFRIGHTLINDDVEFLDNDANPVREEMELADAFFNPEPLHEVGPDPVLKYLATDNTREVDTMLVSGLRNFLFGPPGAGGFDLAARNMQRGRDHGLPDYNSARFAYGLPRVTSFAEITTNPDLQARLAQLYGNVDSIDLWTGGLAEDHVAGGSVGPTFRAIIADQFERLRDGDRFWYSRTFSGTQLQVLQQTRLSEVIRRNTWITKIQDNAFIFDPDQLPNLQPRPGYLPPGLLNPWGGSSTPASIDGRGNNLAHSSWGSAGVDLMRYAPAAYGDTLSTPAGANRPGGRLISNTLCDEPEPVHNNRLLSDWVYGWGQFVDHDLDLTSTGDVAFDIPVPVGDPYFDPNGTGTQVIYLNRSLYDASSGTSTPNIQQQTYTINYQPRH